MNISVFLLVNVNLICIAVFTFIGRLDCMKTTDLINDYSSGLVCPDDALFHELKNSGCLSSDVGKTIRSKTKFQDGGAYMTNRTPGFRKLWNYLVKKYTNLQCSFYDDEIEALIKEILTNQIGSIINAESGDVSETVTLKYLILASPSIPTPKISSLLVLSDQDPSSSTVIDLAQIFSGAVPEKNVLFYKILCVKWKISRYYLAKEISNRINNTNAKAHINEEVSKKNIANFYRYENYHFSMAFCRGTFQYYSVEFILTYLIKLVNIPPEPDDPFIENLLSSTVDLLIQWYFSSDKLLNIVLSPI